MVGDLRKNQKMKDLMMDVLNFSQLSRYVQSWPQLASALLIAKTDGMASKGNHNKNNFKIYHLSTSTKNQVKSGSNTITSRVDLKRIRIIFGFIKRSVW